MVDQPQINSVELAAELTIAWLGSQNVRVLAEDVPAFLKSMHTTIEQLSGAQAPGSSNDAATEETAQYVPAVSVRRSLASNDHIISLIDGKPYKTLRRHLAGHGLTPEQYRERYNLKSDYPMTAVSYSEARRAMALNIGLGAKGRAAQSSAPQTQTAKPTPSAQSPKAPATVAEPRKKAPGRPRKSKVVSAEAAPKSASRRGRKPSKGKAPAA